MLDISTRPISSVAPDPGQTSSGPRDIPVNAAPASARSVSPCRGETSAAVGGIPDEQRTTRDEAISLYGSQAARSASMASDPALDSILRQLRIISKPAVPLVWKPVPGVGEVLGSLDAYVRCMPDSKKEDAKSRIHRILAEAVSTDDTAIAIRDRKDVELLGTVIDRVLNGENPLSVMAEIAEASLRLPNLRIRGEDNEDPPARNFYSVLELFAGAVDDHDPLGRTLFALGASHLFRGPEHGRERAETLRQYMFALDTPPESGVPRITMQDILNALEECGLDTGLP